VVSLPTRSPDECAAALERSAELRRARADLKEQLKAGKTTLTSLLDRAAEDDVVGRMRVWVVVKSMPGVGKVKATEIMERLRIANSRRLRGLGEHQRRALLEEFPPHRPVTVRTPRPRVTDRSG
jgi:hypothetical protein